MKGKDYVFFLLLLLYFHLNSRDFALFHCSKHETLEMHL